MNVLNIEYVVDSTNLGFMASDMEENFVIFMYQPESRESFGGQKLLRKADYHLGQRVNAMFRIQCNYTRILNANYDNKHTTYFGMSLIKSLSRLFQVFTRINALINAQYFSYTNRRPWIHITIAGENLSTLVHVAKRSHVTH